MSSTNRANRRRLSTLLVAATLSGSMVGKSMAAEINKDPCNEEWQKLQQSPADPEHKIRDWTAVGAKCGGSGLYEARMGRLYLLARRYDDAERTAQAGLALGSPYEKNLLSVLADLDFLKEKLDSALQRYQSLITRFPDYYDGYAGVGAVKLVQHQFEESIRYLNEAAKRTRTYDIYRNLTIAYHSLGRNEEAVQAMNEAYSLDKSIVKDRDAMLAAARAYVYLGKLRAADGTLKMLVQANPEAANDPQVHKVVTYVTNELAQEKPQAVNKGTDTN